MGWGIRVLQLTHAERFVVFHNLLHAGAIFAQFDRIELFDPAIGDACVDQAGSAALNSAAATGVVVAASKMSAAPQELLPFNLHLPAA
jgi:hypothetical protein